MIQHDLIKYYMMNIRRDFFLLYFKNHTKEWKTNYELRYQTIKEIKTFYHQLYNDDLICPMFKHFDLSYVDIRQSAMNIYASVIDYSTLETACCQSTIVSFCYMLLNFIFPPVLSAVYSINKNIKGLHPDNVNVISPKK